MTEIDQLLHRAEEVDASENERYGKDCTGDELPKELQRQSDRLPVIQKAKATLKADAALTKALEKKK
ncbi:MAG: hypothetical protein ACJAZN_000071 [Planctomycetota bacterium]|jgi:hypothetical protein